MRDGCLGTRKGGSKGGKQIAISHGEPWRRNNLNSEIKKPRQLPGNCDFPLFNFCMESVRGGGRTMEVVASNNSAVT